ncbi:unnamed protein product [Prorocentrum cordatum]|uniref:EF-hand domain-containing protein n=1 Tax=Prorocentrum cordatum TaxID=2364126 RepID=A0ABN9Y0M0_9DINO|nr:unnamed protein product [Polarella glacialis]
MASPKERLVDLFRALDARGCGRVPRAAFEGALRLACSGDPAQREALDAVLAHAEGDEIRYEDRSSIGCTASPRSRAAGRPRRRRPTGPPRPRGAARAGSRRPRAWRPERRRSLGGARPARSAATPPRARGPRPAARRPRRSSCEPKKNKLAKAHLSKVRSDVPRIGARGAAKGVPIREIRTALRKLLFVS